MKYRPTVFGGFAALCWVAATATSWTLMLSVGVYAQQDDPPAQHIIHHDRWPIKTGVPDGADLDHPIHVNLTDLIDRTKLGNPTGAKPKDKAFDAKRYPAFIN